MTWPSRESARELEEKANSLSDTKIEKGKRKEGKRERGGGEGRAGTKRAREEELFSLHGSNSEQQPDQSLNRRDSLLFSSPFSFSLFLCVCVCTYTYICIRTYLHLRVRESTALQRSCAFVVKGVNTAAGWLCVHPGIYDG